MSRVNRRYVRHPKVRPPKKHVTLELRRLTDDGLWRTDDGKPGVAFVGRMPHDDATSGTIWIADCWCAFSDDCPLAKALEKAGSSYDSSSIVRRPKVSK